MPLPKDEMPYVIYEPLQRTFEYGTAKVVNGVPIKHHLGTARSLRRAKQALTQHGVNFNDYDFLTTGTRPAAAMRTDG